MKIHQCCYVSFTAPSDGSAIFTGSALGVYIDSTYKGYSNKGTYDMKAGETMYLGYRKGTSYLQNITFTPTETPKETVAPTENPIQTSNPQSTLHPSKYLPYADISGMFTTLSPPQTYCENSSMLLFIFTVWNTSLKSESSAFEILILSMQVF